VHAIVHHSSQKEAMLRLTKLIKITLKMAILSYLNHLTNINMAIFKCAIKKNGTLILPKKDFGLMQMEVSPDGRFIGLND
jgi:hypothetical protein